MSYQIDRLDGDRIVLATYGSDFDLAVEVAEVIRDQLAILNTLSQEVVVVSDLRNVSADLDGIIRAANETRTSDGQAMLNHPHLLASLVVTNSRVIELAAKGLNSVTFGNLIIPVFGTLDEALAFARQQLDAASRAA